MKYLAIFILLFVGGCATAPPESRREVNCTVSAADLLIELPKELDEPGDHSVRISRQFASGQEESILRAAEAAYPLVATGAKASITQSSNGEPRNFNWAEGSEDDVLVAGVVSPQAVKYYRDVSAGYLHNPEYIKGRRFDKTALSYTATMRHEAQFSHAGDTYSSVYVVRMELSWSQHCGMLCAMHIRRVKEAVISDAGEVLGVYLDDPVNRSITVS